MTKHKDNQQKQQRRRVIFSGVMAVLTVLALCAYGYLRDYYHSTVGVEDFAGSEVQIVGIEDGLFVDGEGEEVALVFYPGAKVEYTAYLPLTVELAKRGIDCFLLRMPANIAFFDMNAAQRVMDNYDYERWYVGGHSLGGVVATSYAAAHKDEISGAIMLGAYAIADLTDVTRVLSIFGDQDEILNIDAYQTAKTNLPSCGCRFREVVIEGGNHAQFGEYGAQKGDGVATISADEQRWQTAEAIDEFIY